MSVSPAAIAVTHLPCTQAQELNQLVRGRKRVGDHPAVGQRQRSHRTVSNFAEQDGARRSRGVVELGEALERRLVRPGGQAQREAAPENWSPRTTIAAGLGGKLLLPGFGVAEAELGVHLALLALTANTVTGHNHTLVSITGQLV